MSTGKRPLRSPDVFVSQIKLEKFYKDVDLKCVFCKEENESIVHLFYCIYTNIFWCDFFVFFC